MIRDTVLVLRRCAVLSVVSLSLVAMYPYFIVSHLRDALRQRLFMVIVTGSIVIDQVTKVLAVLWLDPRNPIVLIPNILNFTFVKNEGAAFGLFQGKLYIFLIAAIIAVFTILRYVRKIPREEVWLRTGMALLFSGAMGNFIDRVRLGYVIDFIDLHWYHHHWPVFNIADLVIDVGVFMILVKFFKPSQPAEDSMPEEDRNVSDTL